MLLANIQSFINNLNCSAETIFSLLLGCLITLIVTFIFYRKTSNDLRFETRAGIIPYHVLQLLVAYYNWNDNIQPDQYINTTAGPIHYKMLLDMFIKYGIGNEASYGYYSKTKDKQSKMNQTDKRKKDIVLNSEAKSLAKYLLKKENEIRSYRIMDYSKR